MHELTSDSARFGELTSEEDLRSRLEAVSDVLRALSRSAMRLQPILDQIVEAAARLGRADTCRSGQSRFQNVSTGEFLAQPCGETGDHRPA